MPIFVVRDLVETTSKNRKIVLVLVRMVPLACINLRVCVHWCLFLGSFRVDDQCVQRLNVGAQTEPVVHTNVSWEVVFLAESSIRLGADIDDLYSDSPRQQWVYGLPARRLLQLGAVRSATDDSSCRVAAERYRDAMRFQKEDGPSEHHRFSLP